MDMKSSTLAHSSRIEKVYTCDGQETLLIKIL